MRSRWMRRPQEGHDSIAREAGTHDTCDTKSTERIRGNSKVLTHLSNTLHCSLPKVGCSVQNGFTLNEPRHRTMTVTHATATSSVSWFSRCVPLGGPSLQCIFSRNSRCTDIDQETRIQQLERVEESFCRVQRRPAINRPLPASTQRSRFVDLSLDRRAGSLSFSSLTLNAQCRFTVAISNRSSSPWDWFI